MLGIRRKKNYYQMIFRVSQFDEIASLPDKIRDLLGDMDSDSPAIQRLFPSASSDEQVNREFQELAAQDIRDRKLENLSIFEETLASARREKIVGMVFVKITAEEFEYWIGFLNDMRLLLGSELGIDHDYWDPQHAFEESGDERIVTYVYLSYLQEQLLDAHMNMGDDFWSGIGGEPPASPEA
jgi:hypothetical protein